MSTQSIINKSTSDILHDIDAFYIKESDNYLAKINYDIKSNRDLVKNLIIIMSDDILSSNICLNTKSIEEKLKTIII